MKKTHIIVKSIHFLFSPETKTRKNTKIRILWKDIIFIQFIKKKKNKCFKSQILLEKIKQLVFIIIVISNGCSN